MAVQQKVTVSGAVSMGPSSVGSCSPFPSLESNMSLGLERYYGVSRSTVRSISSPVTWVDLLSSMGIASVHFLALRVQAGTLELRVTSALAADQVLPVSDFVVLANPVSGTQLTAVSVRGTADFELIVAGTE